MSQVPPPSGPLYDPVPGWPGSQTPHGADPYNQYPLPVAYPAPQQSGYAPYQASGYPPPYAQYVPFPYPVPVRRPVSGWLLLGAGIAATGGSLLPWTTQTVLFLGTYSASGLQTPIGQVTAMAGVLLLGFGIWCVAGSQPPLAIRVLGVIGFVGVLAISAITILGLALLRAEGKSTVETGIGLWLVLLSGMVGVVGASLALANR